MKNLILIFVFLAASTSYADQVFIQPGSSVTVGATVVTCEQTKVEHCGDVGSSDTSIQVCSKREIGSNCSVNGIRGYCQPTNGGINVTCQCQ
jgi:hypothetical protein